MKKVFLVLMAVALLDNAALSQTLAEHHNLMLNDLFTKYPNGNFSANTAFNEFKQYGQANGLPAFNLTYSEFKSTYFANVTSEADFIGKLVSNGQISQSLANYFLQVAGSFKGNNVNENYLSKAVFQSQSNATKQTSQYSGLSAADKVLADQFLVNLNQSYELWWGVDNQKAPQFTTQGRCRFWCVICVSLFDASGLLVPGYGWALGPMASLIARCCICGSCGDNFVCE
jgi:hypothetical protein